MSRIALVIPLYNESSRLPAKWQEIQAAVHKNGIHLFLVDDGSSDDTVAIAKRLLDEASISGELLTPGRGGKGNAVRHGLLHMFDSGYDLGIMADVDLATPLSEIPRFVAAAADGADVVIASRRAPGGRFVVSQPWWRARLGWGASKLIRFALDLEIDDTQCGFKLFSKKSRPAIEAWNINGPGFDFEILRACVSQGLKIEEIGVEWTDDGDSRFRATSFATALQELRTVRRLWKRGSYDPKP